MSWEMTVAMSAVDSSFTRWRMMTSLLMFLFTVCGIHPGCCLPASGVVTDNMSTMTSYNATATSMTSRDDVTGDVTDNGLKVDDKSSVGSTSYSNLTSTRDTSSNPLNIKDQVTMATTNVTSSTKLLEENNSSTTESIIFGNKSDLNFSFDVTENSNSHSSTTGTDKLTDRINSSVSMETVSFTTATALPLTTAEKPNDIDSLLARLKAALAMMQNITSSDHVTFPPGNASVTSNFISSLSADTPQHASAPDSSDATTTSMTSSILTSMTSSQMTVTDSEKDLPASTTSLSHPTNSLSQMTSPLTSPDIQDGGMSESRGYDVSSKSLSIVGWTLQEQELQTRVVDFGSSSGRLMSTPSYLPSTTQATISSRDSTTSGSVGPDSLLYAGQKFGMHRKMDNQSLLTVSAVGGMLVSLLLVLVVYSLRDCTRRRILLHIYYFCCCSRPRRHVGFSSKTDQQALLNYVDHDVSLMT